MPNSKEYFTLEIIRLFLIVNITQNPKLDNNLPAREKKYGFPNDIR